MNTIGCPDVKGTVELEQNEECQENARNTGEIGIDEEVLGGWSDIVIEAIFIDIHTEEDAAGDEQNIVVDELFGNSIVEGRRAWGSGIELAERVNKELRWGQEEIDGEKTEYLANKSSSTKQGCPLSSTNLTESEEAGEKVIGLELCDHSVGVDGGGVHAKESQCDTYQEAQTKNCSQQDDNDHDVIATNVGGNRKDNDGDEDNT